MSNARPPARSVQVKPALDLMGDLKAALLKRPKISPAIIDKINPNIVKNNEDEKVNLEPVTPASINARASLIVASLKRDTLKNSAPTLQPKTLNDTKNLANKELTIEKQKNEKLQQENNSLKQKLDSLQKKLESQHKVLLTFQHDAKENSKKIYEMETKLDDMFSIYYLIDPYVESNITTKEIAELVHYIAQDFRLDFLHKSALASLTTTDKLRDSFNRLYADYHRVNQDILLNNTFEYQTEVKKILHTVTKDSCLALQKTFLDDKKSKPEEKEWCVIFLSEILKRIKNLEPDSPISLLAIKCGTPFIERNIKKLVEDAKNIQKYLNSPRYQTNGFFGNTAKPDNLTSPYISAITNLFSGMYSKAFG